MTNPKVDWYFDKAEKWQEEIEQLRAIILDCELTEELKWGCPSYTSEKQHCFDTHFQRILRGAVFQRCIAE
jgi:uncharacterized protein YdeI (YjbR/CyaY-like superfamily)